MDHLSIALVSPYDLSFPSGVNNHIINLAKFLTTKGHKVELIGPSSKPFHLEDVQFHSLGPSISIPIANTKTRLSLNPWVHHKIRSVMARKFDIVHIHEPFMPLASLFTLLLSQHPIICTFHAYHEYRNPYKLLQDFMPKAIAKIDYAIYVSEASKCYVERCLPNFSAPMSIIPNGIDLSQFDRCIETISSNKALSLAFIGRDEPRKGLKVLLKALEDLSYFHANLTLIVVGIENLETYKTIFPNLFKTFTVECYGSINNDFIPKILAKSDILCVPSTGGESFGIILLEGLASNTPVVATNIDGYAGVLAPHNYPLVKINDSNSLKIGLEQLLVKPLLRQKLAELGNNIVRKYSWENIGNNIESTYFNICR
tara:strand:- start:2023 stop:3135 length:1113 start_codon:yes stop_codon:yes gene_type:complete